MKLLPQIGGRGLVLSLYRTRPSDEARVIVDMAREAAKFGLATQFYQILGDFSMMCLIETTYYDLWAQKPQLDAVLNVEHYALLEWGGTNCLGAAKGKDDRLLPEDGIPLILVVSCTLREDVFLRNQEFRLSCLDYERHAVQVTSEVLRSFNQSDDRFQFGVFSNYGGAAQITVILSGETPKILFEAADAISALETHWLRDHGKPELVFADTECLFGVNWSAIDVRLYHQREMKKKKNRPEVMKLEEAVGFRPESRVRLQKEKIRPLILISAREVLRARSFDRLKSALAGLPGVTITDGCTADAVVLFDKEISLADYLTKYVEGFYFQCPDDLVSSHTIVLWPTPKAIDSDVVALKKCVGKRLDTTTKQLPKSYRYIWKRLSDELRLFAQNLHDICEFISSPSNRNIYLRDVRRWGMGILDKVYRMNEEAGDERMIEEIIEFLRGIPLEQLIFTFDSAYRQRHLTRFPASDARLPDQVQHNFHIQRIMASLNVLTNAILFHLGSKDVSLCYASGLSYFCCDPTVGTIAVPQHCIYDPSYWIFVFHEVIHYHLLSSPSGSALIGALSSPDNSIPENAVDRQWAADRFSLSQDILSDLIWYSCFVKPTNNQLDSVFLLALRYLGSEDRRTGNEHLKTHEKNHFMLLRMYIMYLYDNGQINNLPDFKREVVFEKRLTDFWALISKVVDNEPKIFFYTMRPAPEESFLKVLDILHDPDNQEMLYITIKAFIDIRKEFLKSAEKDLKRDERLALFKLIYDNALECFRKKTECYYLRKRSKSSVKARTIIIDNTRDIFNRNTTTILSCWDWGTEDVHG